MSIVSKKCKRCDTVKPITEFYKRSGKQSVESAVDVLSECIECMKERGATSLKIDAYEPRIRTEVLAIEKLHELGIWAQTGKSISRADVDVVAWGCVRIEIKWAALHEKQGNLVYHFSATPRQQERGFLADLVMLICESEPNIRTFHLFLVSDPIFYNANGKLKSGWTYTPDQYRKHVKSGGQRVSITDAQMLPAMNRFDMIESVRLNWRTVNTVPFNAQAVSPSTLDSGSQAA